MYFMGIHRPSLWHIPLCQLQGGGEICGRADPPKNAEKCGKNAEKCGKMRKKCGFKFVHFGKRKRLRKIRSTSPGKFFCTKWKPSKQVVDPFWASFLLQFPKNISRSSEILYPQAIQTPNAAHTFLLVTRTKETLGPICGESANNVPEYTKYRQNTQNIATMH